MASPKTRDEVIAISNRVADEWGIPRVLLLACGIAESNLRWDARRPADPSKDADYWPDVSGSVWQQAVRYDPEYQGGSAYPGPSEVERILQRQYDVDRSAQVAAENLKRKFRGDPNNDADILRALAQYNWPAGAGRFYSPEHETNYRRGLTEAKQILGGSTVPKAPVPFNIDARVDAQPDDWSCSIQSAEWLLRSIGRNPGDQWIQDQLLGAGIVTREHGLMDASGQQLANWLTTTYGAEMGFTAQASPVTFDDVAAGAGVNPTLIGGRGWNHWSGVRVLRSDGALMLANPADGWKGVGQSMTRAQFDALGPFTAVWIDRVSAQPSTPPAQPAADTRMERARQLARQLLAVLDEPAA